MGNSLVQQVDKESGYSMKITPPENGTWKLPHCGCGHPMLLKHDTKCLGNQSMMSVFKKGRIETKIQDSLTKYCLCCNESLLEPIKQNKNSDNNTNNHNTDTDTVAYYQCGNDPDKCFLKIQLYSNLFESEHFELKYQDTSIIESMVRFRLCFNCGNNLVSNYNTMITSYYDNKTQTQFEQWRKKFITPILDVKNKIGKSYVLSNQNKYSQRGNRYWSFDYSTSLKWEDNLINDKNYNNNSIDHQKIRFIRNVFYPQSRKLAPSVDEIEKREKEKERRKKEQERWNSRRQRKKSLEMINPRGNLKPEPDEREKAVAKLKEFEIYGEMLEYDYDKCGGGNNLDCLKNVSPVCICGNENMSGKINCVGKFATPTSIYRKWQYPVDRNKGDDNNNNNNNSNNSNNNKAEKNARMYFPTKLICNKCELSIHCWDPYYSCQYGGNMNENGHKYGYRICKYCAILEKSKKYTSDLLVKKMLSQETKTVENENENDNKNQDKEEEEDMNRFELLSDDLLLLICDFSISSHLTIVFLRQSCKIFNTILTKMVDPEKIKQPSDYRIHHNNESNDISTKNPKERVTKSKHKTASQRKKLVLDPTLNRIWQRLVLYRWPTFMNKKMTNVYNKKINQRWDLFFQIRFKTAKNHIYGEKEDDDKTGKDSGYYYRSQRYYRSSWYGKRFADKIESKKVQRAKRVITDQFIEGCFSQLKSYSNIIDLSYTHDIEDSNNILSQNGFKFKFECPLFWSELTGKSNEEVPYYSRKEQEKQKDKGIYRTCQVCDRHVYQVKNKQELNKRVKKGDCVFFDTSEIFAKDEKFHTKKMFETGERRVRRMRGGALRSADTYRIDESEDSDW